MSDYKSNILNKFGLGVVEEKIAGETVFIKKMSGKQYEDFMFKRMNAETRELDFSKYPGMRAELICMALVDPDGNRIFDSADEANEALRNEFIKDAFDLIQKVNGTSPEAAEDAEKN